MVDIAELLTDLAAESDDLDRTVAPLSDVDLSRPTPSPGWTIAHQIAHLTWTDRVGLALARWPALADYRARVAARPKVRDAMIAEGSLKESAATV